MRAGAVTLIAIEAGLKAGRSPTFVRIGATVTPRDQSVKVGPLRSAVVWSGIVSARLCPEMTFSIRLGGQSKITFAWLRLACALTATGHNRLAM